MFQFRAFPSYGYFIHRTILEYCSSVLPHSDISGSSLICSSPKLFAACRVLHRLLMPRHSPCALISLTCVETNSIPLCPPCGELRSIPFLSPFRFKVFALKRLRKRMSFVSTLIVSYKLVLLNYAGSTEVVYKIVFTHYFLRKLKFHNLL